MRLARLRTRRNACETLALVRSRLRRIPAVVRLAAVLATVAMIALAAAIRLTADDPAPSAIAALERCALLAPGSSARGCYSRAISAQLSGTRDPTPALVRVDRTMTRLGSYPASNCHLIMHSVGRRYAVSHHVTLATLMSYLPRTNDPGCAAGFAHGVIMAIAPDVLEAGPKAAETVCERSATRYQRYSCTHGLGHAYMRFYNEALRPSLKLCRALGRNAAPDCAQGAYHDYWLAIAGKDQTTGATGPPRGARELCDRQPGEFVLPCWYRAFIDTRPAGYETETPQDLRRICLQTSGLQRQGCITAASVIGSPNPLRQLRVCSQLAEVDMMPCVRGTKVQNLEATAIGDQLRVINRCGWFPRRVRAPCYRWLGKVLAVTTDGDFLRTGCPQVADRQSCERGARSYDGALVTFS
ncbi:MAG: hypothetical protein ACR2LK_06330 [Solirubrobacteraceae bacterium]